MPAPPPEPAAHGDTFILGSGPSLTRLDDAQRHFLDAQPFVFAMNKYLLYWDRIGVHPSHAFLADTHFPAYLVLQRSVRRARELRRTPVFCLHRDYARFVNAPLGARLRALPDMARLLWRARGTPVRFLSVPEVLFFDSGIANDLPLVWARSLDEPLYFYRGSLSVLLNLATILNPGRPIHLLGVDMNTPVAFYEDAVARERRLHDRYRAIGEREGVHPTVAVIDGTPGILHRWEFMARSCADAGCPIDNANAESLLVQRGLCAYNPVPSAP